MADSFVLDFLDKARACTELKELSELLQQTVGDMGFERWAYQTQMNSDPVIIHNFPQVWVDHYIREKCSEIDPVVTKGTTITSPFQWSIVANQQEQTSRLREYTANASDVGLRDGLAVPIVRLGERSAILSVSANLSDHEMNRVLEYYHDQLIAISFAYHGIANELLIRSSRKPTNILTLREKEFLLWAMRGKTAKEVARLLGLSPRTVSFHSSNIKRKLQVTNIYHAIVKAIMEGHIAP